MRRKARGCLIFGAEAGVKTADRDFLGTVSRLGLVEWLVFLICMTMATAVQGGETRPANGAVEAPINFAVMPIHIYQRFISAVNGHSCPMTPSCSQYGIEAFKKHGYLKGWILTSDRLLRCGRDEIRLSPRLRNQDQTFSYDPIKNNDFWWFNDKP